MASSAPVAVTDSPIPVPALDRANTTPFPVPDFVSESIPLLVACVELRSPVEASEYRVEPLVMVSSVVVIEAHAGSAPAPPVASVCPAVPGASPAIPVTWEHVNTDRKPSDTAKSNSASANLA